MKVCVSHIGRLAGLLVAGTMVLSSQRPAQAQQITPDQAAMVVLDSARRAYDARSYGPAVERFREFLRLYGGHKEAPAAHYGLALSLLDTPDKKDFRAAIESLRQVVDREDFPDRPTALYFMGVALRGIGNQALSDALARPNEAPQLRNAAAQQFSEAAAFFDRAAAAFAARVKTPASAEGPSSDFEWSARAQCDRCEMLLRLDKFAEANEAAGRLLADRATAKSRYHELALYQAGYARFSLADYVGAGRALIGLVPFQQEFGVHARYLLARAHHMWQERPEAAAQYDALLTDYDRQRKAAQEALKNPAALQPAQKAAMESLAGEVPEHVVRASFYRALLACEEARYGEALEKITAFIRDYPKSPLLREAQLRQGFCLMQLKKFPDAVKVLQPLASDPALSDQALAWMARAQVGGADPANPQGYQQALAAAMETLRRAAEQARLRAGADPRAAVLRGDILMDLADTMQLAAQYKDAAATYDAVARENANSDRAEEAAQRQATALHMAGLYDESDAVCAKFEKAYPRSTLLPAVWFRNAENAYLRANAAARNAAAPARRQEAEPLFSEAIRRYDRVIKEYPDFPYANLARYGMASAYYQLRRYPDAIAVLTAIPEAARVRELATVPYLLADCLVRTLPVEAGDALQSAQIVEVAGRAARLLDKFVAEQGTAPQAPDALLKLGHCCQRMASVLADPEERRKQLALARGAYERFTQQFASDPSLATAVFERAQCLTLLGDANTAAAELGRFRNDPLRSSPLAPLALLRLSILLRAQNKAAEAAALMQQCRTGHEANLLKDPERGDWVPLLQYEHGLALKESEKPTEARKVFEALSAQFPTHPAAINARWRTGQSRREELVAAMAAARDTLSRPTAKPEEMAGAKQTIDESLKGLRETIDSLQVNAEKLAAKAAGSEPHLRMLYEIVWCFRALADAEIEASKLKLQQRALEDMRTRLPGQAPAGQPPPALRPPDIPLSGISVRPFEVAAREQYARLITLAPTSPLAGHARLELAEMYLQRGNADMALDLLNAALEKDPPRELADAIRLALASSLLAKTEPKPALTLLRAVMKNAAGPLVGRAQCLLGEAFMQLQEWPKAAEQLLPFRDQPPLQNVPEVSDRALLRLATAYAQMKQWDANRQTLGALVQRFPQSRWVDQALYDIGWSWQSQKQHDAAVNAYVDVTRRTISEWAAKAQYQIGMCRLEQKRPEEGVQALLVVPITYDYPEWSAAACLDAAEAYVALKQPQEAVKLWLRIVKDYPTTRYAATANERLARVK